MKQLAFADLCAFFALFAVPVFTLPRRTQNNAKEQVQLASHLAKLRQCMNHKQSAQTGREVVGSLDREFARLHLRSCVVIQNTPDDILYSVTTSTGNGSLASVGENVLRCAAAVEQTFGGITSNLWDDPFEWTLPEYLSTSAKVIEHLVEVEETRKRAFVSFDVDSCLLKHVATPSSETRPLVELLLETLVRAAGHQGRAVAALRFLSGISTPGFII